MSDFDIHPYYNPRGQPVNALGLSEDQVYAADKLKDWTVHTLTPEEITKERTDTARSVTLINMMRKRTVELTAQLKASPMNRKIFNMAMQLHSRIDDEVRDLNLHYWRLFPINELPTEILTNILSFVVWSISGPENGVLERLIMTWTCRRWRIVAIADATIWNAIWFRDKFPYKRSFAFLDRAANAEIDMRINDDSRTPFTNDVMKVILDKIRPRLSNIRMLIVIIQDWEPLLTMLKFLNDAGQAGVQFNFTRLEIQRHGPLNQWPGARYEVPGHARHIYPLLGGAHCPSLQYLSSSAFHLDWDKSVLTDLTTFDIRRLPLTLAPSPERFIQILAGCPRLVKLSLDGAGPRGPLPANLKPVRLTHLATLVLAHFSPEFADLLMSYFTAPNTKDLTLMGFERHDYSVFYRILTGRFPKVRVLSLFSVEPEVAGSERALIRLLHSMPQVEMLKLGYVGIQLLSYLALQPSTWKFNSSIDERILTPYLEMPALPERDTPHKVGPLIPVKLKEGAHDMIFPKLWVVDVQNVNLDLLPSWLICRWTIGRPIQTVYVPNVGDPPPMSGKSPTPLEKLMQFCENKIPVRIVALPDSMRTADEENILAAP